MTKPNLSNWIDVPGLRSFSFGSPFPFVVEPSGIIISMLMLSAFAGSHWINFVFMLLSGSDDRNEKVLGFILSTLSDLKFRRCINL